jgi:hypothetical protein
MPNMLGSRCPESAKRIELSGCPQSLPPPRPYSPLGLQRSTASGRAVCRGSIPP